MALVRALQGVLHQQWRVWAEPQLHRAAQLLRLAVATAPKRRKELTPEGNPFPTLEKGGLEPVVLQGGKPNFPLQ